MTNKKLEEYLKLDKSIKEAEAKKEKLKNYVQRFLKRCRKWGIKVPNFGYSECSRFEFVDDLLYKWVAFQVSEEELLYLTKKSINLERLQELVEQGRIDSTKIPPECYTKLDYQMIRIRK